VKNKNNAYFIMMKVNMLHPNSLDQDNIMPVYLKILVSEKTGRLLNKISKILG